MRISGFRALGLLVLLCVMGTSLLAQEAKRSTTNLPYRFQQVDAFGNFWMLYHGGRLMQQGNMPFCTDVATLTINNQQAQTSNQTAILEGTGEVVLENLRAGSVSVTRRYYQSPDGYMRVCDILRNSQSKDMTVNVTLGFNINYGIQSTRTLPDPRNADKLLANLVTDSQNRTGLDVFAGRGSKLTPSINAQPNNSMAQASYEVKIPAGKQVALVHFHALCQTPDQAEKLFAVLREAKALSSLPAQVRKLIINFPAGSSFLDDLELLRGGPSDIIELSNGDQLRGTLLAETWEIQTDYGKLTVPASSLLGMFNIAGIRPRQLLVTSNAEVIGGKISAAAVDIQLSNGQKVSVPVNQVSRLGRKSDAVDTELRATGPMLFLRTGDRLSIKLPATPLRIATRFGALDLKPESLAILDMQPEDSPSHLVTLTDGSRFNSLFLADELKCTLNSGQVVTFPASSIRKLVFASPTDSPIDGAATLKLTGDDVLAVSVAGKITLSAAYGDVEINTAEIRQLNRLKTSSDDVQVTLWDNSIVSGRLAKPYLECTLAGTLVKVPVGLIDLYSCPAPQPTASLMKRIQQLVADLNADDWKQRERAEAELLSIGDPVIGTLKQLRAAQPPEAQQRIDSILKQLSKPGTPTAAPGTNGVAVPVAPVPFMIQQRAVLAD